MKQRTLLHGVLVFAALFVHSAMAALPEFTRIVEQAGPAVVKITAQNDSGDAAIPNSLSPEEMPEFFRRFFENGPNQPRERGTGVGSGFFISDDGYLITNHHVVTGADTFTVRLPDKREFAAELIGSDQRTDIALLKVEEENLPYLEFGDSNSLQVGQWVLAIGSPFGVFEYSATAGIVSALSRSLPDDSYVPFIQTDVAVNPGNSGGPLFDLEGKVVGVNSQIYTRSGGFMGLSFAIPAEVVQKIATQLREKGFVTRGWLGVTIQQVSDELAESFGLDDARGALVSEVNADSPAEAAGFEIGDIITRFDGVEVETSADLPRIVGNTEVGKEVDVEISRGGETEVLEVTVGELTEEKYQELLRRGPRSSSSDDLGVTVVPASRDELGEARSDNGLKITEVRGGSPAEAAGLQPNDILVSFNRQRLNTPQDLEDAVDEAPRDRSVPVLLVRGGTRQFIALTLE